MSLNSLLAFFDCHVRPPPCCCRSLSSSSISQRLPLPQPPVRSLPHFGKIQSLDLIHSTEKRNRLQVRWSVCVLLGLVQSLISPRSMGKDELPRRTHIPRYLASVLTSTCALGLFCSSSHHIASSIQNHAAVDNFARGKFDFSKVALKECDENEQKRKHTSQIGKRTCRGSSVNDMCG